MNKKGYADGFTIMIIGVSLFLIGLLVLLIQPFPLIEIGGGNTFGHMTTYDEGIFYDTIWIRAEYESSQTDAYCVRKGEFKQTMLTYITNKERVKLTYDRFLFGLCRELVSGVEVVRN